MGTNDLDQKLVDIERALDRLSYRQNSKFLRETGIIPKPPLADYMASNMPASLDLIDDALNSWRKLVEAEYWDIDWRAATLKRILETSDLQEAMEIAASYTDPCKAGTPLFERNLHRVASAIKDQHSWLKAKGKMRELEELKLELQNLLESNEESNGLTFELRLDSQNWEPRLTRTVPMEDALSQNTNRRHLGNLTGESFLIHELDRVVIYLGPINPHSARTTELVINDVLQNFLGRAMAKNPMDAPDVLTSFSS